MADWGAIAASVYRSNGTATDVTFKERDGTAHLMKDCHVGQVTVRGFGAGGAVQVANFRTVRIPRTGANVKPEGSWTGSVDGQRFSPGLITTPAGLWIVEEAA